MTEMKMFRFGKKFAWDDEIHIAVGHCEVERDSITGNTLHMLTFNECADHLRHEVCEALGADVTFLKSIEAPDEPKLESHDQQ